MVNVGHVGLTDCDFLDFHALIKQWDNKGRELGAKNQPRHHHRKAR